MLSARQFENCSALGSCFLLLSLLLPLAALTESKPAKSLAARPSPNGLVVVLENKPEENQLGLRALKNPYIRGVALQIRWRDIEPVRGQPNWSKLDQLLAAAESSNKWVQLLIFPGFFSPSWAIEGADPYVADSIRTGQRHTRKTSIAMGSDLFGPLV